MNPAIGQTRLDLYAFSDKQSVGSCALDGHVSTDSELVSTSIEGMSLGLIDVLRFVGFGLSSERRTYEHIREDRIDDFIVAFPLTIPVAISQAGRHAVARPGSCILLSTRKPFHGVHECATGLAYSALVARVPGPLLREQVPNIDDCCAQPIEAVHGSGKITRALIENLIEERDGLRVAERQSLSSALLQTITTLMRESPEFSSRRPLQRLTARASLYAAATGFIAANLSNPELDVAMVASHCRVAPSYLQAAFADQSESVGAYIRNVRLERCREALRNPALQYRSIIEIAMAWGFNSSSSFNHAYRLRYGQAPSQERPAASEAA